MRREISHYEVDIPSKEKRQEVHCKRKRGEGGSICFPRGTWLINRYPREEGGRRVAIRRGREGEGIGIHLTRGGGGLMLTNGVLKRKTLKG